MKALGIYSDTDSEDLSRRLYSTGLKIALTTVRMNKEIGKYNKLKLKHLDSILGIIENNFDEKNFGWSLELHGDYNEIPSKLDIKKKFDELVLEDIDKINFKEDNQSNFEYLKRGYNYLKNCRRVIYRLLNNEPLYLTSDVCLISEEINLFKRFAEKLSHPPEKEFYYKKFKK